MRLNAVQQQADGSPEGRGELQLVVPAAELAEFVQTDEAEHVRRLEADLTLIFRLNLEGFGGPTWRQLSEALVEYGLAVMRAWIRTGIVYSKLRRRGIRIAPLATDGRSPSELEVGELALDTVAEATLSFKRILAEGTWNPGRGATLATYFIGNCLLRFPNVLREWTADREKHSGVQSLADPNIKLPSVRSTEAVVMDVMGLAAFEERLFATPNNAPDEQILKFLAAGYSVPEIAELTGLGKRQVSNRVYRIRRLLRERGLAA